MRASIVRYAAASTVVLFALAGSSRADDFIVKLSLKNAHLRSVFFGCQEKASSGYDRRVDDFAPPPGIQTGYVGFVPGVKGLPLYYKDIRGPETKHEWQFYVKVHEGKPLTISWDRTELPANWAFSMSAKSGALNMSEVAELTLAETQIVKIQGTKTAADSLTQPDPGKAEDQQKQKGAGVTVE